MDMSMAYWEARCRVHMDEGKRSTRADRKELIISLDPMSRWIEVLFESRGLERLIWQAVVGAFREKLEVMEAV